MKSTYMVRRSDVFQVPIHLPKLGQRWSPTMIHWSSSVAGAIPLRLRSIRCVVCLNLMRADRFKSIEI